MKVFLHSSDTVTSSVIEIMQKAKELSGVRAQFDFAVLDSDYTPPNGAVVLALGAYKRRGGERIVHTYSVKQIMSKGDAISRLMGAFRLLESTPELPEFLHVVDYDLKHLETFSIHSPIVVDIETRGVVDKQIPAWKEIIAISLYNGEGAAVVIPEQTVQTQQVRIQEFLTSHKCVGHNLKFDGKYLGIYPYDDTMLMHYAAHPAASDHGLKALAKEYFGAEDWDSGNKVYTKKATYKEYSELEDGAYAQVMSYDGGSGYERIPRTMLYEYAGKDVYWTYWLYRVFLAELEETQPNPYEHLLELSHMFQRIESGGVRFDVDYMEHMQSVLTDKGIRLEQELCEVVGFPVNPRSPKQLKDYFASVGYKLDSTNSDTLKELSKQGNKVADLITQLRDVNKKNGTYITGYLDKLVGGRGYPTFKLHASITGRIGGGGTSLLTIPTDNSIRRMALPEVGHKWVGADLSQAELRVMALESQDPWLIDAFQPEAGDFFDILLSQALPEHDWFTLHKEPDPDGFYTEWRRSMKSVVYGASFSRGAKAIAIELGIPVRDSEMLMDAFIRPGSEFDLWRKKIQEDVLNGKPLVNKFGRHFQAELITARNQANILRSALSFTSQSTANDLLLATALRVEPELHKYGARMLGTIHDAMETSVPPEHAEAVGEFMARELVETGKAVYGDQVLFESDWNIGDSLADN